MTKMSNGQEALIAGMHHALANINRQSTALEQRVAINAVFTSSDSQATGEGPKVMYLADKDGAAKKSADKTHQIAQASGRFLAVVPLHSIRNQSSQLSFVGAGVGIQGLAGMFVVPLSVFIKHGSIPRRSIREELDQPLCAGLRAW